MAHNQILVTSVRLLDEIPTVMIVVFCSPVRACSWEKLAKGILTTYKTRLFLPSLDSLAFAVSHAGYVLCKYNKYKTQSI